jgi:hypothetical protein
VFLLLVVDLPRSLPAGYTASFSCHTPEMIIALEMRQGAQRSLEHVQSGASGLAELLWTFSWLGNVSNLEAHE